MSFWKSRKTIASGIALSLIIGGGALYGSAYAADDSGAAAQPPAQSQVKPDKKAGHGEHKGGQRMDFVQRAADVLGMKADELRTELKAGKSISDVAQAKGVSADTVVSKLSEQANAKLDEAVKSGKLTADQAANAKTKMAERIKMAVEQKGLPKFEGRGHGHKGKGSFMHGVPLEKAAAIVGLSKEELKKELDTGKSLAEVAQAHGVSRDQLIAKLKDGLTPTLEKFVDGKREARKESVR